MKSVTVLSSDRKANKELSRLLEKNGYKAYMVYSASKLEKGLKKHEPIAVLIDIDAIPITKSFVKQLFIGFSGIKVLSLSEKKFHPDLQDIISHYIYACLSKPIDSEELVFLLKSIEKDNGKTNDGETQYEA